MKRFYKNVSREADHNADGFRILLDGKPVKTPNGDFLLPATAQLADGIVAEWDGQVDDIRPETMHLTQLQNTLQDRADTLQGSWRMELQAYLETDLLCYRTDMPEALAALENAHWQPWLDWLADKGLEKLPVTDSLAPITVPDSVAKWLKSRLAASNLPQLMIWRHVAGLTGSCVLGLAVTEGACDAENAFTCATLDEQFYSDIANEDVHGQAPNIEKAHASLRAELAACARFAALA